MHLSVLFGFCVSRLQDPKELKFSAFSFPLVTMRIVLKKWNPNHPAPVKQKYFHGETDLASQIVREKFQPCFVLSARGRKDCVEVR